MCVVLAVEKPRVDLSVYHILYWSAAVVRTHTYIEINITVAKAAYIYIYASASSNLVLNCIELGLVAD